MATDAAHDDRRLGGTLGDVWRKLTLARQFTVAAVLASLISVLALGTWVSRTLEGSIIDSAGAASAVYISHFLAPHLQELAFGDKLSPQNIDSLNRINESVGINIRLQAIKVWLQDGRIVYSSNKELIGEVYHPHESLTRAWGGLVTVEFDHLNDEENAWERRHDGLQLLEVYVPIYSENKGDVIAVAEFYEQVGDINGQLARVRWQSWLVTTFLASAMIFALFSIVADGSKTIEWQRGALTERISELSRLLQQNRGLRDRVKRGARQVIEDHERFLHQIGSDLHDGPAQLVGLALLRLDQLQATGDDAALIRDVLSEALDEIRNTSAGLLLPEARDQDLKDALLHTIRDHERRTRTSVSYLVSDLPSPPPRYVVSCLCRVAQEGLTNAFRHAGGKGQTVSLWSDDKTVTVEVCDQGPGMQVGGFVADHKHLGLIGLRGRVESIGGTLTVECRAPGGTRLVARLPVIEED